MGWSVSESWNTRSKLVKYLTTNYENQTCLAHCLRGNILWSVWYLHKSNDKFIRCDKLQNYGREGWGYKDMDESMHPYYYTCPISYLGMAPVANQEWRDLVVDYQKRINHRFKIGQIVGIENDLVPSLQIIETKPKLIGRTRTGQLYRFRRSQFTGEIFDSWPITT